MNTQQHIYEESTIEQTAELLGIPVDAVQYTAASCTRKLVELFGSTEAAIKALQDDLEGECVMFKAVFFDHKIKHKKMCIDFYKNRTEMTKMVYDMIKNPLTGEKK